MRASSRACAQARHPGGGLPTSRIALPARKFQDQRRRMGLGVCRDNPYKRQGFQFGDGQLRRTLAESTCVVWRNTGHVARRRLHQLLACLVPRFQANYPCRAHRFSQASFPDLTLRLLPLCTAPRLTEFFRFPASLASTQLEETTLPSRTVRFPSGERRRSWDRSRSAPRICQCGLALVASGCRPEAT